METILRDCFRDNLTEEKRAKLDVDASRVGAFLASLIAAHPDCPGLAFVTSGGTTVPLEVNAVRYLTNFSSGGRGAYFTETLVERGWGCVLVRHQTAIQPFRRVLDALSTEELFTLVRPSQAKAVPAEVRHMHELYCKGKTLLLEITYDTVMEYLYLLQAVSVALCQAGGVLATRPLLFLAACAVSDYFIPHARLSRHKISCGSGLDLHFDPVPKALGLLRESWLRRPEGPGVPQPFIVSFKLETTEATMHEKAAYNLGHYHCNAVVANMLQSYKEKVWVYVEGRREGEELPVILRQADRTLEACLCDYLIPLVLGKVGPL